MVMMDDLVGRWSSVPRRDNQENDANCKHNDCLGTCRENCSSKRYFIHDDDQLVTFSVVSITTISFDVLIVGIVYFIPIELNSLIVVAVVVSIDSSQKNSIARRSQSSFSGSHLCVNDMDLSLSRSCSQCIKDVGFPYRHRY
jgi:hypothetical protein